MNIQIPGIRFIQSTVPLEFNTDGTVKSILPDCPGNNLLDTLFILSDLHYELFNLKAIPEIKSYNTISLPDNFPFPALFDGTQNLSGKKILLFMLTGRGDTILIEPVIRIFYEKIAASGKAPEITIAGNWINNFPYSQAPYIHNLFPNILSLNDLREFDVLVNFIPAHLQRSAEKSLQELFGEILHVDHKNHEGKLPLILPATNRVTQIRPVLETIRKTTGKKLLCVNWLSRFSHKNADAYLFVQILNRLKDYQAVVFNDKINSDAIDNDIKKHKASIINLSDYIDDYHDTIAALSLMDAFISVDTGIVHAAGALRVPGVALFGPFPPGTHVFCYPSVIGLRSNYAGTGCKGPCLETHRGCREIDYRRESISPCFQTFSPEDILKVLKKALSKNIPVGKR